MTDPNPNKPRRRWAWCCCSVVLVLALVPLIVYLVTLKASGARLAAELTRLRQAGEPLTLDECAPKIAEGEENAAEHYEVAFNLTPAGLTSAPRGAPGQESEAAKAAREQDLVAQNQEYYSVLEYASRIPKCAFQKDWSLGPNLAFPEFARFREAARALQAQAEVARRAGRTDAAVGSCVTSLRAADHAGQSPTLIGNLVSSAMQGLALGELERVFSTGDPSPKAGRALYEQLGKRTGRESFAAAMRGERALGLATFDALMAGNARGNYGDPQVARIQALAPLAKPWMMQDKLNYLHAMERNLEAVRKPYQQAYDDLEAIEHGTYSLPPYSSMITQLLLPVYTRGLWSSYRSRALAGAAQIATAAKAYKVSHGRYPASLQELAQTGWRLPMDPFTNAPYHYAREQQGIAVWSVGSDLTDNGGVNYDAQVHKDQNKPGYDFVFRCAR